MKKLETVSIKDVTIEGAFWSGRQKLIREVTIPKQWEALNDDVPGAERSCAVKNFRLAAKEAEGEYYGQVFQDSDLAKWLESVAYALALERDERLERIADEVIDLLGRAQQPDGYLNTYFTVAKPGRKFTNLRDDHELYCAGHLIEAAVAYYEATGKRKFLDIMCKYADLMAETFGPNPGQIPGYDGHPEIELALVKLYKATGNRKYLELSKFFIDERGQQPYFFDIEESKRTEHRVPRRKPEYFQAHLPVREQKTAEGHAVRALYLFSGAVDIAAETGDRELLETCKAVWRNVTRKRMYVTGGVGSNEYWESFTIDYDLPNDRAYAETCAAISLVLFAHRLLQVEADREYADVMERALYNGILSGISLDGQHYFYVNPLELWPDARNIREDLRSVEPRRVPWFSCACCPPNIARLIASLGQYVHSVDPQAGTLYTHLYVGGTVRQTVAGRKVTVRQTTDYPWDGKVTLDVTVDAPAEFALALRLPGWCRNPSLSVNGEKIALDAVTEKGYAYLKRTWTSGDRAELELPMPVEFVRSHPQVRENAGKIALQRGPLVYCLEEADNGNNLRDIRVSRDASFIARFEPDLLNGVVVLEGSGWRSLQDGEAESLYSAEPLSFRQVTVKAVPYYAWANREPGEMLVWIQEMR